MNFEPISVNDFSPRIFDLWLKQWMLLTSGSYKNNHYNTMTVAWGSIGAMWNKPFVQVVVRPTRFTFEFMEKYQTFTLCAFREEYRNDLQLLGTKSGRDGDKIAETRLEVIAAQKVDAPVFRQAELVIECKKLYWQDLDPENFLNPGIEKNYPRKDYHRIYFGQIEGIFRSSA